MSRPPPPSSVSQFSKVGRNLAKSGGRLLVDQAKVSDAGGQSSHEKDHEPNASDGGKSSGNWPKMGRASKGEGSERVEDEGQKMRNSLELELTKYYEK